MHPADLAIIAESSSILFSRNRFRDNRRFIRFYRQKDELCRKASEGFRLQALPLPTDAEPVRLTDRFGFKCLYILLAIIPLKFANLCFKKIPNLHSQI